MIYGRVPGIEKPVARIVWGTVVVRSGEDGAGSLAVVPGGLLCAAARKGSPAGR